MITDGLNPWPSDTRTASSTGRPPSGWSPRFTA